MDTTLIVVMLGLVVWALGNVAKAIKGLGKPSEPKQVDYDGRPPYLLGDAVWVESKEKKEVK